MAPADPGRNAEHGNLRDTIRDISRSRESRENGVIGIFDGSSPAIFRSRKATLFRTGNCARVARRPEGHDYKCDTSLFKILKQNGYLIKNI